MKEETAGMVLPNEMVSAIVADECRADGRMAERVRADCGGAMNDLMGVRVPDGVAVRIAENAPDTVHVPLPHYSHKHSKGVAAVMSEAELEQISGGELIAGLILAACVVGGLSLAVGLTVYGVKKAQYSAEQRAFESGQSAAQVNTVGEGPSLS